MAIPISPAFLGFVFAATITPGPNNLMLMASGANYGFRRTAPHILGVGLGVLAVILLAGLGLVALLDAVPVLRPVLEVAAALYFLWLAWKIANAGAPREASGAARPFTLPQAALFQFVNPKIWAIGLSAMTVFAPDHAWRSLAVVAVVFTFFGLAANVCWAAVGTSLRHVLAQGRRLRIFNIAMALLLVGSLLPLVWRG